MYVCVCVCVCVCEFVYVVCTRVSNIEQFVFFIYLHIYVCRALCT